MTIKRVMIAPLDWGLGHATRCIPIIHEFMNRDCEVVIAGSGASLALLKDEFPSLNHFEIAGYDPVYSASSSLVVKMAEQSAKFLMTIRKEHRQTEQLVKENDIDVIISDNRYGCWSANAVSVFLTHQLNIIVPPSISWLKGLLDRLNHVQLKKFSHCWIPDIPGEASLSGTLSSTGRVRATYVGWLSRFSSAKKKVIKKYDIAAILSGPEPQRSILECKIMEQVKEARLKCILVRGKPGANQRSFFENTEVVDSLNSKDLQAVIEEAEIIISRSGYSTIMDLIRLEKKAVLIPTPGQTEQEYLAGRMEEMGFAFYMDQHKLNVRSALRQAEKYKGFCGLNARQGLLEKAVDELMYL